MVLRGRLRPAVAAPRSREEVEDPSLAHLEMADVLEGRVRLAGRDGKDLTATFSELAELVEAVAAAPREAGETVLDGEVVALDGRSRRGPLDHTRARAPPLMT